ncbi:hypothetical protein SPRG_16115 [Saprolegnia parasitica CBS 223.65]|uniref:F-box domain-containing protein n=1 Tax=Saprolegnia parasitica (strain CBS 223.65) TaxID=695850 RepID=A0A067BK47_SAPPC|nr:hypothetical protein SPRG_16115 [Saprolegnia parasitica CBS 223.65]KDO18563.1 hypothetical protein SPRG_16115 [Saprolegnia parasitica CBS 223.65]|eukprot:XP_012210733.1 hypothetical protein SPRG_16115 [Saprolegnia parasitica CBS 223.65]
MDQQGGSKQACVAPIAVVHTNILVDIMRFLDSTKDLLSLVQALPRDALDASLVAFRTLLVTPNVLNIKLWPQVCIEDIDLRYTSTVLAALPIFRSIRIAELARLNATLLGRCIQDDPPSPPSHDRFRRQVGHKVDSMSVTSCEQKRGMDKLQRILRLCTGLRHVDCTTFESAPMFLNVVVHAVPHVQRLAYCSLNLSDDDAISPCEPWRPVLSTWLASGHATHLHLDNFTCDDDVGLGHCIAATASLTSLKLQDSPGVVQGLVAASVPLPNITELRLHSPDADILNNFVTHRMHHPRLRVLELAATHGVDVTFALALLPQLSALEELAFGQCTLREAPALDSTPSPRLRALRLTYCDMENDVLVSLLDYASRSPCLETVELNMCDMPQTPPELERLGRSFRQCIEAGVRSITLHDCELTCVEAIAKVVRALHQPRLFVLKIDCATLRTALSQPLLKALATCTGVRIEWSFSGGLKRDTLVQMRKLVKKFQLRMSKCGKDTVWISSPM